MLGSSDVVFINWRILHRVGQQFELHGIYLVNKTFQIHVYQVVSVCLYEYCKQIYVYDSV